MSSIRKAATILLAAAAMAGLGTGVSGAATPAAPSSGQQDIRFFNASPYKMIIARLGDQGDPFADLSNPIAPVIDPGQSFTMTASDLAHVGVAPTHITNSRVEVAEVDQNSNTWDIDAIQISGYQPGVDQCNPVPNWTYTPEMGCMVQTPDVLGGESGPMQVSIWTVNPQHKGQATNLDASNGDRVAMGSFLSGLATEHSGFVTYNPDVNTVSWGYGTQTQAGQAVWNCDSEDANEQIGGAATHEESTNVTGTFGITQGVKLFNTVDTEINASISFGHTWTNSTTDNYTVGENIAYHNVGWLGSIPSTETVSGTVTATTTPGYPMVFSNVSFTEPGLNKTNDLALDYQYVTHSRAMTSDEINTYCGGSSPSNTVKQGGVVIGGTVPDVTAGAH